MKLLPLFVLYWTLLFFWLGYRIAIIHSKCFIFRTEETLKKVAIHWRNTATDIRRGVYCKCRNRPMQRNYSMKYLSVFFVIFHRFFLSVCFTVSIETGVNVACLFNRWQTVCMRNCRMFSRYLHRSPVNLPFHIQSTPCFILFNEFGSYCFSVIAQQPLHIHHKWEKRSTRNSKWTEVFRWRNDIAFEIDLNFRIKNMFVYIIFTLWVPENGFHFGKKTTTINEWVSEPAK